MLRIAVSLYGDMGEIGAGWCVSDEFSLELATELLSVESINDTKDSL